MDALFASMEMFAKSISVLLIVVGAFLVMAGGGAEERRKKGIRLIAGAVALYLVVSAGLPLVFGMFGGAIGL